MKFSMHAWNPITNRKASPNLVAAGQAALGTISWISGSESGYCVNLVRIGESTHGIVVPLRSLHVLIKLLSTITLVLAPLFI